MAHALKTRWRRAAGAVALTALLAVPGQAQVFKGSLIADGTQSGTGSPGTCPLTVTVDQGGGVAFADGQYSGLNGTATAAHIHGPAAPGQNAGILVSLNVSGGTSGTLSGGGNANATTQGHILGGMSYVNIHSTSSPGGEIRAHLWLPFLVWSPGSASGSGAIPTIDSEGTFMGGSANTLRVTDAPANSGAFLVIGLTSLRAPFKGGILGPNPDFLIGLPTDPLGNLTLPYLLPPVPSSIDLFLQVWIQDPGVPTGLTSTETLRGTTQ